MRRIFLAVLLLLIQPATALGPVGHMRVVLDNWHAVFDPVLHVPISDKSTVIAALVGSLTPDAGYMYDRLEYFTDLAHYVRAGDLATTLIRLAETPKYLNDRRFMAFALGFYTHYWADRYGHYYATNRLVAELEKAKIARVTYEHNTCDHTWVETQLSVLDVKQAPQIVTTGFIQYMAEMTEPDDLIVRLYEFLREGIQVVFPQAEVAFKAYDLYRFYRLAAGLLCMIHDAVGVVEPGGPRPLSNSCKAIYDSARSEKTESSTLGRYKKMIDDHLGLSDKIVSSVYDETRQRIRSTLVRHADNGLDNFNLDTNLPSRGGQYRCADSAFQKAAARAAGFIPSTIDQKNALRDFSHAFDAYKSRGNHLRAVFNSEFNSASANQAQAEIATYLFDVYPTSVSPVRLVQTSDCSSSTAFPFTIGKTKFFVDNADRTVCYTGPVRTIDAMYAKLVGAGVLNRTENDKANRPRKIDEFEATELKRYAEAVDRLRLDDNRDMDQSGLYKPSPCPVCNNFPMPPSRHPCGE